MGYIGTAKSGERLALEGQLERWFAGQGVSKEGASRAVQLLDPRALLAQARPSTWNRRGHFGAQERCRYLWYRHAARILGWCERKKFPDTVTDILRNHIFPSDLRQDEAIGEDGAGSVSACSDGSGPQFRASHGNRGMVHHRCDRV